MGKKVAIATLGCKVNQFESASFSSGFQDAGCCLVDYREMADIYVINTCAVTARAGQQSRQLIRRVLRTNPGARCVVTGCYAEVEPETVAGLSESTMVIGNSKKHLLVSRALDGTGSDGENLLGDIARAREICPLPVRDFAGRTRAFLRVQDGCNNFCSYCIVPHTRGRCRSLPLDEVMEQATIFFENGYREIVITGINVGKYGLDLDEGATIFSLLQQLCTRFPEVRFRLSSIEPTEIDDELLALAASNANFMPHFHIPLQSGDDGVLQRMRRRYSVEKILEVVVRLHRLLPGAAVGVDVLAGFPGEDEAAHEATVRLLAELPISYLHVFPYSRRPGTPAAAMSGQVAGAVIEERVRRLRELDHRKRVEFYQRSLGKPLQVLVEGKTSRSGIYRGFSENYIPIFFEGTGRLVGRVVGVLAQEVVEKGVSARLLERGEHDTKG